MTDAVGHLLAVDPVVQVQTKSGAVVEFSPADVVALRVLTDAPVRTRQIRALEHAAAAGWPGEQHCWLDGWLLRAGPGAGIAANSAVPLGVSANVHTVSAIVGWYRQRALTPRLAIPDRLLPSPPGATTEHLQRVLVRDVSDMAARTADPTITLSAHPDDAWLRTHRREIPVDALTAVIDGEVMFGVHPGTATARAAVTDAPDGTRWVGLSALRGIPDHAVAAVCEALLAWGAVRGATRAYLCAPDTDATATAGSLGFRLHHRRRYFPVSPGSWDTV